MTQHNNARRRTVYGRAVGGGLLQSKCIIHWIMMMMMMMIVMLFSNSEWMSHCEYTWPSEQVQQLYDNIVGNGTSVFYVSPKMGNFLDVKNCTSIDDPCNSIRQVELFLRKYRKPSNSVLIRLLDGDGTVAILPASGIIYSFGQLFMESFGSQRVEYNWDGVDLSSVVAEGFNFINVSLSNFRFTQAYKTVRFIDSNIDMFNGDHNGLLPMGDISFSGTVVTNSKLNSVNQLLINKSKIIKTTFRGLCSTSVTIVDSELSNSHYTYLTPQYYDIVIEAENFLMENTILVNSSISILRFNMVNINNIKASLFSSISQKFCGSSLVNNLIGVDSFSFRAINLDQIATQHSNFVTTKENREEPTLYFDSIYSLRIISTNINSCNNIPISIKQVSIVYIYSCGWSDNMYGVLRAVNDFSEGSLFKVSISTISGNRNVDDGTIYVYGYNELGFEGVNFLNNTARRGGAIYFYGKSIVGMMTVLAKNSALTNGGAVYYKKETTGSYAIDNCDFRMENNTSLNSGGAIYLETDIEMDFFQIHERCTDNLAYNAGGCIYSTRSIPFRLTTRVKGNIAYNYGQNLALPMYNATFNMLVNYGTHDTELTVVPGRVIEIDIYPGQSILSMDFSNFLINEGERMIFLSLPVKITTQENATIQYSVDANSMNIRNLSLTLNTMTKQVTATITFEKTYSVDIAFNIIDCPTGMVLKNPIHSIFICSPADKDSNLLLYVVIPISIACGILLTMITMAIGFLLVRCFRRIYKKASLFDRKLKAEQMVEKKINDRQAVFYDSSSSAVTIPLLQSNSFMKKSQLIIPLEDIEIINKIAEGGNGSIYLASWKSKDVALKSLKTDDNLQDEEFEKEVAVLSMLDHHSIVKFYGVCISENRKFMVVEYYPRGSLDKLIYNCKVGKEKISITQKLSMLLDVAEAMAYLHSLNPPIVHRDLKPGNILLSAAGNARVCDFGLSKVLSSSLGATKNIGTIFYIPTEMMNDSPKYNTKVDVYSFAIILYELFFEESPYLNYTSPKIYKFRPNDSKINEFNILIHVLNGARPVIPFINKEEQRLWIEEFLQPSNLTLSVSSLMSITTKYMELMKKCWSSDPNNRPSFADISHNLQFILEESKQSIQQHYYQAIND